MKLVNRLLAPVNTTFVSLLGAGQAAVGFWLTLPFDSWSSITPTLIPEPIVGSILLVIGLFITAFSLLANLKGLQWSTTAGYIFWLIAMVVMMVVHIAGTAWVFSLIFATYCFMISLNIRVNRKWMR